MEPKAIGHKFWGVPFHEIGNRGGLGGGRVEQRQKKKNLFGEEFLNAKCQFHRWSWAVHSRLQ